MIGDIISSTQKGINMTKSIMVAILEDHQSIIDGYIFRLSDTPEIQIVATAHWGDDLKPMLDHNDVDVLVLDLNIPTSSENRNLFPILHTLPSLLADHPDLSILVISMITSLPLIEALEEVGVSGYISKDDSASIQQLGKIISMIANGGVYFTYGTQHSTRKPLPEVQLTPRQTEVLSLCAAYPDDSSQMLAKRTGVSSSTIRNLLSTTYMRLGVRTRAAAIAKAQALELIPYHKVTLDEHQNQVGSG
jgi:two-component system, NarL family, nitrate/nitrite response regulator NarL